MGFDIYRGDDKALTGGAINAPARPGAVDPRAQQVDVFPLDAFEFDDPKRNVVPVVRLKLPWVLDGASIKAGTVSATSIDTDSLFSQTIVVPTGGSIRYETGSGVQKRCVQLADEKIDWLDTPDTSPASPEQLRARIGRLGVGGSILMDGDFLANITSSWSAENLLYVNTLSSFITPTGVELDNGQRRVAYRRAADGYLVEIIWNGTSWGSETVIDTTASSSPEYIKTLDGGLRLAYYAGSDIYERIWTGSAWGGDTSIASGNYPAYIQRADGQLRIIYTRNADSYLCEKIWNGSSWGTESIINSAISTRADAVVQRDSTMRVMYVRSSDGYLVERTSSGTTWSNEATICNSSVRRGNYVELINGDLWAIYRRNSDGYTMRRVLDTAWSSETTIYGTSTLDPIFIQLNSGDIWSVYQRADNYDMYEHTLQRYAQIGAGIIESGSNSNGSWVKYGDGTMECWGRITTNAINVLITNYYGTTSGNSYYNGETNRIIFPKNMINALFSVALAGHSTSGTDLPSFWGVNGYIRVYCFETAIAAARTLSWRAIGRWKA